MVKITSYTIDPSMVYELLSVEDAGSVVLHFSVDKPVPGEEGASPRYIEYRTDGDAEAEMQTIADELSASYNLVDTLFIRRTGRTGIGSIVSLAAVAAPDSEEAFAACKEALARLNQMKTIVKTEICG